MVSLAKEVSVKPFQDQKLSEGDAADLQSITIHLEGSKISSTRTDLTESITSCSSSDEDSDNMVQIYTVGSDSEEETKNTENPAMELEMEEAVDEVTDSEPQPDVADDNVAQPQDKPSDEVPDLENESVEGPETEEKQEDDPATPTKRCYAKVTAHRRASLTGEAPPIPVDSDRKHRLKHMDSIRVGLDRAPPKPAQMRKQSILKASDESITKTKSSSSSKTTRLKFDNVVIREYSMTLGDHPNCSIGPPVSLDWEYEEFHPLDLDEYESVRGQRRTLRQMMLNYYQRKHLFENVLEYSQADIKACEKACMKAKRQREITRTFLPVRKVEEVAQSATRKFKRVVVKKKQVERIEAPVVAF